MSLAGLEMVFFLPVVLLLYWAGPRSRHWQNGVLAVASALFYFTWSPRLLWLLAVAIGISFGAGWWLGSLPLEGVPEEQAAVRRRRRRWIATAAVLAEVGILAVFKYSGFFVNSLSALLDGLGVAVSWPVMHLALPLGISYTTLIQVGYLLEVYWERTPPCRDPLAYGVFVAFFPQLIAGPIARPREQLPQYLEARRPTADAVGTGSREFLLGFTLKSFVADWAAPHLVDPVFQSPLAFGAGAAWAGLLGYAVQLFGDFAGYSLMALGVGRLFGVMLPVNFRHPYLSKSLAEFWRRWHISLNTWLFDYLFAPLTTGRSWFRGRAGPAFLLVFLVSGLWHGPTWTYVLWGGLHGIALWVHHAWDEAYKGLCRRDRVWVARRRSRTYLLASWALTQVFFLFTLIPFRAPDLGVASDMVRALFGAGGGAPLPEGLGLQGAAALAFFLAWHLAEFRPGRWAIGGFERLPSPVRGVVYGLWVVFLTIYVPLGAATFIYGQF